MLADHGTVAYEPLNLTLSSKLTAAGESGTLKAVVAALAVGDRSPGRSAPQVTLKSTRLPLELAGMVLHRFDPAAHFPALNVRLTCSWDTDQHFEVDGEVQGDQLEAGTRCLGPEPVQLDWLFTPFISSVKDTPGGANIPFSIATSAVCPHTAPCRSAAICSTRFAMLVANCPPMSIWPGSRETCRETCVSAPGST